MGYSLVYRGYCRAAGGETREAIRDAREGLRLSRALFGDTHYIVHLAESLTGAALGTGTRTEQAEAAQLLQRGADGLRETLGPAHPRTRDAAERLAEFVRRTTPGDRGCGSGRR
ncbi:MAG: hypothetical protein U5K74_14500 [Gemmatimonadaceae bacterium]|nr:hypothetical protein [Gemmatimonadaceae bacterium]